jgi:hypothetical protein
MPCASNSAATIHANLTELEQVILKHDILQWILVATALLSGTISGQMLAIGIANWAARDLPEMSWTLRFQAENKFFTSTMPPSLIGPMVGIIGALFFVQGRAFALMVASAFFTGIVLVITTACNVPINNQVGAWAAGSAPSTWRVIRDRWLIFHSTRTVAGVIAFGCIVVALVAG